MIVKPFQTPAPRIEAADVPLPLLVEQLAARRIADGAAAELRHLLDPADSAFAALACACPDGCSCDATYPGWAEHIAALQTTNRTRAHKEGF